MWHIKLIFKSIKAWALLCRVETLWLQKQQRQERCKLQAIQRSSLGSCSQGNPDYDDLAFRIGSSNFNDLAIRIYGLDSTNPAIKVNGARCDDLTTKIRGPNP